MHGHIKTIRNAEVLPSREGRIQAAGFKPPRVSDRYEMSGKEIRGRIDILGAIERHACAGARKGKKYEK